MDVREVAVRLAALGAAGLPLVVGVECDPVALRRLLAVQQTWTAGTVSGPHQWYPTPGGGTHHGGPPAPRPAATGVFGPGQAPPTPDPVKVWGPPGSAQWARGDTAGPATAPAPPASGPTLKRTGTVGETLQTDGPDGERLAIQLVEVVDPADYLLTAAGHRLEPGQRSVVVHTELTNTGTVAFTSLPDQHLVLMDGDGQLVARAAVTLSSRPPHRSGVSPGETAGGHTVYVLPEAAALVAVRWSPRPGDHLRSLIWTVRE